eukprot:1108572-Pyramimonas_sp.AAC.1
MVEQPINSLVYHVQHVRDAMYITCATRMIPHLGAFGGRTVKPLEVWTTLDFSDITRLSKSRREAQVMLGGAMLYAAKVSNNLIRSAAGKMMV